jgi:ribosomal protein S6
MQTAERIYEVPVWIRLDDDGSVNEARISRIREAFARLGAQILHETKPTKRRLAYPIAKFREGAFVVFDVLMNPSAAGSVIPAFKHDQDVIRIGIAAKAAPQRETIGRTGRSRAPTKRAVPAEGKRPAVEMGDLEKKLEEILHGNAGV